MFKYETICEWCEEGDDFGDNGYYLAEWQETDNGMELVWKPKKAYIIDTNPDIPNSGTCYGVELNMGKVHGVKIMI